MFLKGRRKTGLLRGTAGIGVALILAGLYRPAFATVPEAKATDAKGLAHPAGAPTAAAAGPPPVTATAPSAERVRGAIVPVAVKLDKGAMGADPWALFDGDATSAFKTGQPVRVRVSLPKGVALEAIGVYGGTGAVVAVTAEASAGSKPIAGLENIALDKLPARWNRFSASAPTEAASLLVDITPAPGQQADVPELELWGRVAPSARPMTSAEWAEALLTHLPAGALTAAASPAAATIAAPQVGPAGHVPLTFELDRAGRLFERAFLVYELEGLPHWSAVVRRVNWQAPQGGFHAMHAARHGLQVEEISPEWLREGRNELEFIVSDRNDLVGYTVKNARVIGIPATGNPIARAQIDTPRADKIAAALVDGSRDTGLTNKDLRRAQTIDFHFAEMSQPDSLMVAVDKGARGTLSAQAIVRGKVERGSEVAAELDRLGDGWARISLDSLPAEADGIRVTLRGARGESTGGLVSELRVTGSRLPTRRASGLTVTYPLHGECVDGEAYVRGFLRGAGGGGVKGAALRIGGANRADALKWDGSFSAVVPTPSAALRSGGKWQVELEASFANGDATGAVVDIEGCKEPVAAMKHTGPVDDEGAPYGQVVRAGERAKLSFAGATLEIPAGALDDDTRITIRPVSGIDVPATDESLTNVTAGGRAYRLGPHGLKFAKAVSLTVPFDRSRFVGGQAEDDMGAYFFDQDAKRWRQVQTLKGDASSQLLTAATTHFTDFIAGTISSPDHPTADSFNPNSIKDLKAADPTAGIQLIAPPEPSPDGAAHLSFPLWVPPGRQGMQPSLTVTYNSSAGNGLMGMGWSLPISSIGVDTRFGVARYSRTEETETYEIDGELLVPDPCGNSPCPARQARTNYHRKAEGKFDTIIRVAGNQAGPIEEPTTNNSDDAYHWEVLDKRGARYIYGESYSSRGSTELRGVYRWYLSRVIDAFGNQIVYTYEKTFPALHVATDTPTVRVLLTKIEYTADSSGQNAHYRVDFLYDGQPTGDAKLKEHRADVFTNARGGSVEVTDVRLARIRVYQNPDVEPNNIRRYDFPYFPGTFDKSLLQAIIVAQGALISDVDDPTANNEFYRHSFNYNQIPKNPTTNHVGFDTPVAWSGGPGGKGLSNGESDAVNGSAMGGGSIAGCDAFHGVIGGSSSLSIPVPLPDFIAAHNKNQDTASRGLVDVNGDGLPDFVSQGSVQLNRGDASFSAGPRSFIAAGSNAFQPNGPAHVADHSTVALSAGGHFLSEAGHVTLAGKVWGSSGDNVLLSDIDGDGFVDYLNSGTGSLNPGGQGFSTTAAWDFPKWDSMSAEAVQEQKNNFVLTEPISMWLAPFSGHVNIQGFVQKVANAVAHTHADGVRLIVDAYRPIGNDSQGNPVSSRTRFTTIDINDAAIHPFPGITDLFVRTNDRIYFRINSIDDIEDDAVNWNPVINYQDTSDDNGGNRRPLTGEQLALPEPFSGAAFGFVQGGDMRLAGEPIPTWHDDSAGPDITTVTVTSPAGRKEATSDSVTLKLFKIPNGSTTPVEIPIPGFRSTYDAAAADIPAMQLLLIGPNGPQMGMKPGDRLFFQVSSPTPIDTNQVKWKPHVEYGSFCRVNTVPVTSADFSQATTICGGLFNCASGPGCQIVGDPNPNANHIASTTVEQDIAPYFQLQPWAQARLPSGFIPPGNGTVRISGSYTSTFPARLMVRGLNRQDMSLPLGSAAGVLVNVPAQTFPVTQGNAIMFDIFGQNTITFTDDAPAWIVNLHYDGPGGPIDRQFDARQNWLTTGFRPGSGRVHGWRQYERNIIDPTQPVDDPNFDSKFQADLLQGPASGDRNNFTVKAPVSLMRQAPDGLQPPPPDVGVAGPLWAGASVDGYIGEGKYKPSRTSRPITGSRVVYSNTKTTNTDTGASFLFGTAIDYSSAATDVMFIDMNGDRYPDLVTPNGIRFNQLEHTNPTDPTQVTGGHFEPERPIKNTRAGGQALGALDNTDGRQASASLGISGAVATYMRMNGEEGSQTPGWVSMLPSLGISYGNSQTTGRLMDINGDGLPDYVKRENDGSLTVRLNIGFRPDDRSSDPASRAFQFTGDIHYDTATWETTGTTVPIPTFDQVLYLATSPPGDLRTKLAVALAAPNTLAGSGGLRSDALRVQNSAGNDIGSGYSYFGGGLSFGLSRTTTDMIDINGDGLPDMVKRDPTANALGTNAMSVKYNLGDRFGVEEFWDVPSWPNPQQGPLQRLETVGFGATDALAYTETSGTSESAGFSRYWETGEFGCWGFELGVGASQTSTGSEMRFEDIDGDGAPDQILKFESDGDANVYVRRNPSRGTVGDSNGNSPPNLLTNVFTPLGGLYGITYARLGNIIVADPDPTRRVDMPDRHDVMVKTFVGGNSAVAPFSQDPAFETHIDYGLDPSVDPAKPTSPPSGVYDRVNREFLGFSHVTITRAGDGQQVKRLYDNQTYFGRHQLLDEQIRDTVLTGGPKLFRRTSNHYDQRQVFLGSDASKFSALVTQKTSFYEALTNDPEAPVRSTTIAHDYDETGNPIVMSDLGDDDLAVGGDDIHYAIAYQSITDPATGKTFPRPKDVFACSAAPTKTTTNGQTTASCLAANVLRHRFAFYGTHGEMLTLTDDHFGGKDPATGNPYVSGQTDPLVSAFIYDAFGNVQIATDPTGFNLTYIYDSVTNSHIATIRDGFGYQSTRLYDLRFGSLLDTTDVNGYREHYDADKFGRQIDVVAPQDIGSILPGDINDHRASATVAFDYAIPSQSKPLPQAQPIFWARTKHKDFTNAADTIDTVVFVDGFGRVRQTKKDATLANGASRIVSGQVTFDSVGRVYQEGFPISEPADANTQTAFRPYPAARFAKTNSYDVLERLRAVQTPDDNGTTTAPDGTKAVTTLFSFDPKTLDGRTQMTRTVTDPQGKVATQYLSPRGEILAVSEVNRVGAAFPFGTSTVLTTRYSYDRLSELFQVQDAATVPNLTKATYDSLGNMVMLQSPDAGQTEWRYDTAGRLAVKETANLRSKSLLVKYGYEFNRLKTITYPPATAYPNATSLVTYTYGTKDEAGNGHGNIAGRLAKIQDESGTETRQYDALGYLSRMEKTPMTMSPSIPGVTYRMDYVYDPLGRVKSMTYPDLEQVIYGYDSGGLVNGITSKRPGKPDATYVSNLVYNELGQRVGFTLGNGWSTHNFYYLDTRRLASVQTTSGSKTLSDVVYSYDLVGNIKNINNQIAAPAPVAPNTVIAPGPTSQSFTYDDLYQLTNASGTYTGCACGCGNTRNYALTMQYDAIGNISLKNQTDSIVSASGTPTPQVATTYNNGYTYGAQQSFGQKAGPHAPTGVGPETLSYDRDGNQTVYSGPFGPSRSLTWTEDDRLRTETDSGFTNTFLYDAGGNRTHKRRTTLETWYVNPFYVVKNSLTESKHIMLGEEKIVTAVATITNRADPTTAGANTLFYYHSDHVQSTSYMTGGDGSILQHDEYFPSGEVWFQEQKNNDARNTQPYLFNAKELDETGLYSFGARYYNPKLSVWTSTDPILKEYMQGRPNSGVFRPRNLGTYTYASNNPIGLRDPDGRTIVVYKQPNPELERLRHDTGVDLVMDWMDYFNPLAYAYDSSMNWGRAIANGTKTDVAVASVDMVFAAVFTFLGLEGLAPRAPEMTAGEPPAARRLAQDEAVNPDAPKRLSLWRSIGKSVAQNRQMRQYMREAKAAGGRDFRVNQQQVNAAGERVGINRPDLQYTDANGVRQYVEFDDFASQRGGEHASRIMANDPAGQVTLVRTGIIRK
jgi:RHS repeat-associated protein